ncbi:MAG: YicC/YloC family endoribonuclease [Acetobacteraceae bacterium]|nr:YicC/YloC family endoribonuclease [Acetobacteraceae bacterium]
MSLPPTLASMTGFARDRGAHEGVEFTWEIRSVNGRGLDLRFRLPLGLDGLEPALREAAARTLRRGSVTATLALSRTPEAIRPVLDEAALDSVLALIERIRLRLRTTAAVAPEAVLALPGVLRAPPTEEDEAKTAALHAALLASFHRALEALLAARRAEGARLGSTLAAILDEIDALTERAAADAAAQPEAIRARLLDTVRSLLAEAPALPEERLAQEVTLLASRADVREEIERLRAHLAAARALLAEGGAIGRRLDFLAQEFAREANTLCAKSASTTLTATGLALKAAIEQLREQVQNVE